MVPLLITCTEETKRGCFCSLDFDIFLLLGVCFRSFDAVLFTGVCVCVCRSRICAEAAPRTLLLTCNTPGNVLENGVVVAVAALRTWLGAGPGCCVSVVFPDRCYGA